MQVQWWRCVLCGFSGDEWHEWLWSVQVRVAYIHLKWWKPAPASSWSWLVTMSGWSCTHQNHVSGELCYLFLLHCYISPFTFFVEVVPMGNLYFTQHITKESVGGGDTVLFTIIIFMWQNIINMVIGRKILTHIVLKGWKNGSCNDNKCIK